MAASATKGPKGQPRFPATDAPDLGVDEEIVADYAAKVGNRRVGTTAERNAAAGADLWEGLEWYDTTLKKTFWNISGVWSDHPDTVQAIPTVLFAGWAIGADFRVSRLGSKATAALHVRSSAGGIGDGVSPGVILLAGFKPKVALGGAGIVFAGGAASAAGFLIDLAGQLVIYNTIANNTEFKAIIPFDVA